MCPRPSLNGPLDSSSPMLNPPNPNLDNYSELHSISLVQTLKELCQDFVHSFELPSLWVLFCNAVNELLSAGKLFESKVRLFVPKNSYLMQFYEIKICQVMIFRLYTVHNKYDDKNSQSNHRNIASIIASVRIILLPTIM